MLRACVPIVVVVVQVSSSCLVRRELVLSVWGVNGFVFGFGFGFGSGSGFGFDIFSTGSTPTCVWKNGETPTGGV